MNPLIQFVFWLMSVTPGQRFVDYGSQFAQPGDKWAGGASVCLWREVRPTDHIIAHRTLPCGTKVLVRNMRTNLATIATVGDHGPYGACLDEGWVKGTRCQSWVVKKHATDPGTWRGSFDLTPSVGKAIGQTGIQLFEVTVLHRTPVNPTPPKKPAS